MSLTLHQNNLYTRPLQQFYAVGQAVVLAVDHALDADAFAVFKREGIFNPETAQRFRDCILSKGGTENPMTLYKNFRGGEPTIDALLKRNGIRKR